MSRTVIITIIGILLSLGVSAVTRAQEKDADKVIRVLLLDGQNNHYIWPKTSQMMKSYLEETGLFEVDIYRTKNIYAGIKYNPKREYRLDQYLWEFPEGDENRQRLQQEATTDLYYAPPFEDYGLVLMNLGMGSAEWPEDTKRDFEEYMRNGGALVVVHAANNAFGDWAEFNKMIGLGAWGGRNSDSGPYVYFDDKGEQVRDNNPGICGSHGLEHEFTITTRESDHPIMRGLPPSWMHAQDELYDRMRGPAENMTILATAYSDLEKNDPPWDPQTRGSERNEPMLMVTRYGKGRVFHSALGHFDYSQECVGFITTLQRGAEWAATGQVTQALPDDFPGPDRTSTRSWTGSDTVTQTQIERQKNNPYTLWQELVHGIEIDARDVYDESAVGLNHRWEDHSGAQAIGDYWDNFGQSIDSTWTSHYIPLGEYGAYAYEIGGFSTADGSLFAQLIIWKLGAIQKKRLFEFNSPTELISFDKSQLDEPRARWMQYCNAHKVDSLVNELYTEDALYYNHRPLIKGRSALIKEYGYMNNPNYQLILNPTVIEPLSNNLVIEIGQCEKGYNGKYILIWQRSDNGQWQIAFDSNL